MLEPVDARPGNGVSGGQAASEQEEADRNQIAERLRWTPKQRLQYLLDMLAFEERAHRARPLTPKR